MTNSTQNYHLEIDVPGVKPEDLEVTTEPLTTYSLLHVRGKRGNIHLAESYIIPGKYDTSQTTTTLSLGILTVEMPLKETSKPRKIEVKLLT